MKDSDLRKFGFLLGAMIPLLFGILLPFLKGQSFPYWPWVISIPLIFLAVLFPRALKPLHRLWSWVGHALGFLNTRILLTLVFFLIFTPLGWFRRLLKKERSPEYRVPSRMAAREEMERPY